MKQRSLEQQVNNIKEWAYSRHCYREIEILSQGSLENLQDFWVSLFELCQQSSDLKLRSSLFHSYDFYHDCIIQHLGKKRVAFIEAFSHKEWTFDHLHRLVNYQVSRWQNHAFESQAPVVLVMPLGIHFLVALLMSLRLGLRITLLPTDSPLLTHESIRYYLKELKGSILITTPESAGYVEKKENLWLIEYLEEKEEYKLLADSLYPADKVLQLAISCHAQEERTLEPVLAHDLYLGALRDGFLALGLRPGIVWGYSPQCSLREQPFLLLTGLLHGAATFILSEKELVAKPQVLDDFSVHVLGISSALRELWTHQKGLPKSKLKLWYRHIFDDEGKKWDAFIEKNKLHKLARARLVIDNARAGLSLISIPLEDHAYDSLWPALGVEWGIYQLAHQDIPAVLHHGLYKQLFPYSKTSNFILTQLNVGWELGGTIQLQKKGYTIPIQSIEEAASSQEFVEYALFLGLPTVESALSGHFVLLVFINPFFLENLEKEEKEWKRILYLEIKKKVGEFFIPDQIEFFPFLPKLEKNEVDRKWCAFQYTNGMLAHKKHIRAYSLTSLLKKCLL